MISCHEALELLYDILDKEASEIDAQEVKEHLSKCGKCLEKYRLEESVHDLLKTKINAPEKDKQIEAKVENLKSKIMLHLDDVDNEDCGKKKDSPNSFFNITKILVSTAALVVFVISGYLISHFVVHYKNYMALEEAHWSVDANQSKFYLADSGSQYFSKYSNIYNYSLRQEVNGFQLVDARSEMIDGVDMDHLVYKMDTEFVSIFLVPAENYMIPEDVMNNVVSKDNFEYFDHHCRGCRLLFHQIGNLVVIAASTNHSLELAEFINKSNTI